MSLNPKGAEISHSHMKLRRRKVIYMALSPLPRAVLCELKKDPLRFGGVEDAVEVLEYNLFANYKPRLKHDQAAAPLRSGLYPGAREELA